MERSVDVAIGTDQVKDVIRSAAAALGLSESPVPPGGDALVFEKGSEGRARFWGGAAVAKETLPIRLTVGVAATATGSACHLRLIDGFRWGFFVGMKGRYERYADPLLNALVDRLGSARSGT